MLSVAVTASNSDTVITTDGLSSGLGSQAYTVSPIFHGGSVRSYTLLYDVPGPRA